MKTSAKLLLLAGLLLSCLLILTACGGAGEEPTDAPTEAVSDAPTEAADTAADVPTEPATEAPAVPTEAETDPADEPTEVPTEPATEAVVWADEASVAASVPVPVGNFTPIDTASFICGQNGSIVLTDIGEGVLRVDNNAAELTPEARSLSFSTATPLFTENKDNMYAYLTVFYYIPKAFSMDEELWIDENSFFYISMGDEYKAYKTTALTNSGGNKIPSAVGAWNVYECPVSELRGDTFGLMTEKGSAIYIGYVGVVIKVNAEHELVKFTRPDIPAGYHPLDICEYDENGKEIKRNLFPGNAAGSIVPVILDVLEQNGTHSELVQVFNYASDTSYDSRSFRFMGDPIKQYRSVPGAKFVFDLFVPEQYTTEPLWPIDDKAIMYFSINNKHTTVPVNPEEYAAEGDFAVKPGGWTHYEILISDMNGGQFGFYTQGGTYFYYCNIGVVVPE